ncbi:substrate-binding domain-containing protein [Acinetobacter sp. LF10]|uniref:substrate-binding domain-containing protein n=1 Tax=Acinetobacter sp. LF10 TaxID=3403576 RepID=UPI003B22836D
MLKKYRLSHYFFPLILSCFSIDAIAAINVYGPGGPAPAIHEAAKQFKNKTGIEVNVVAGPTAQWEEKAKLDADIFYSGSEAMMSDLELKFSNQIIKDSIEPIYIRPAAILVRKGNPKNIQGFHDLAKPNTKVLVTHGAGQVGMWEDIAGRTGNIQLTKSFRKNIVMFAPNTGVAKKNWEENSSYDAWLVFNIWGISNPDIGQIIPIEPNLVIYRDTGIALTQHSLKNSEAKSFIEFLKSQQGNTIFKKFGWTK